MENTNTYSENDEYELNQEPVFDEPPAPVATVKEEAGVDDFDRKPSASNSKSGVKQDSNKAKGEHTHMASYKKKCGQKYQTLLVPQHCLLPFPQD